MRQVFAPCKRTPELQSISFVYSHIELLPENKLLFEYPDN